MELAPTRTSYVGAAHTALRAGGFFAGDLATLMGASGFAFHFFWSAAGGPTAVAHDWLDLPVEALDRLGVDIIEAGHPAADTEIEASVARLGRAGLRATVAAHARTLIVKGRTGGWQGMNV